MKKRSGGVTEPTEGRPLCSSCPAMLPAARLIRFRCKEKTRSRHGPLSHRLFGLPLLADQPDITHDSVCCKEKTELPDITLVARSSVASACPAENLMSSPQSIFTSITSAQSSIELRLTEPAKSAKIY
ncbi:unnamed protein product [Arctogadus glacialis]